MKTVTQDFLDAQSRNRLRYRFSVDMYRRYWDAGTSAYVYEASATDLKPYILARSNIAWQLDTEGLNVWRVSNVQLELKNERGQFNEGSGTFFDATYERFKTKIVIKVGYLLADGTTETVYSFTGLVVNDPVSNHGNQSITFTLSGREILLTLANAENVSQAVTGETIGTGALINEFWTGEKNTLSVDAVYINDVLVNAADYTVSDLYNPYHGAKIVFDTAPSLEDVITCDYTHGNNIIVLGEQIGTGTLNNIFYTANKGVGAVNAVYVDGQALSVLDYETGNLNDKDSYGKVTLPVGLAVGQVVTADYEHWYKDVEFTTLLGYLLDEGGFPAGDRTIGAIDISALLKYEIWNTKADWDGLSSSRNADTASSIGSVQAAVENLDTDITENLNVTVAGTYPAQTGEITDLSWDTEYVADAVPGDVGWTKFEDGVVTEEISPAGYLHIESPAGGYLWYRVAAGMKSFRMRVKILGGNYHYCGNKPIRPDGDGKWYYDSATHVYLGLETTPWDDYHVIQLEYIGDDVFVFVDGVFKGLSVEAPGANVQFGMPLGAGAASIDYVDYNTNNIAGILTANALDLVAATSNYGTLLRTWTDPADGSTLHVFAQTSGTSDFASDNDLWREVTFVGNVGTLSASTVAKKYLRWRVVMFAAVATSPTLTLVVCPAHLRTASVDCGANLDAYDAFTLLKANNNGVLKVYSQTSANDSTWEAEAEVVAGVIASTQQRYIRFRTVLYYTATGTSPRLDKQYLTYTITSLNIAMANFTGLTVQAAIENLAKLIDYEIGVDAEGKYFFRQRNTSATVDLELSDRTNVLAIDNDGAGWSRIYNDVTVTIGNFTARMSPVTLGTAVPHSITKYGTRALVVDTIGVSVDDDLDLASALVTTYYNRYYLPKRELRLKCRMLPQLELSDTVNINYRPWPWFWYWGDPRAWWGKPGLFYFSSAMLPLNNIVASVTGLELDLNAWVLYVTVRAL